MKRIFDISVAALVLFLVSPLLLLIVLAIKLSSPGPVFYSQQRVGFKGRPFKLLKFRSMVPDADKIGPYYTDRYDQRITRCGRWLRKTSLDELPQLINVLKGEMSLVGPRPDVLAQQDLYSAEEWQRRHQVLPGITGLAQATLRSSATMEKRKELDFCYVSHQNFWLDLKIILLTIKQIFSRGGF